MAYATEAELAGWLPAGLSVPVDAARLLASASRLVDRLCVTAVYDVEDGAPSDVGVAAALRDATCAQAAWWIETGDEQGAAAGLNSAGSGGGPYWGGAIPRVAPGAVEILAAAVSSTGAPLLTGPLAP